MKLFRRFKQKVGPKDKFGDPWLGGGVQGQDLAAAQRLNSFGHNKCPHCGEAELREGPRGPGAVNCLCAACGSKFNDMGFTVDLLRLPTNPIPEMKDEAGKPRPATHDLEGPIVTRQETRFARYA